MTLWSVRKVSDFKMNDLTLTILNNSTVINEDGSLE